MEKHIITISREFGSGGRTIGKLVAEHLGIRCYDAELIQKLAAESGFDENYIKEAGEYTPGGFLASAFTNRSFGPTNEDLLWKLQYRICINRREFAICTEKTCHSIGDFLPPRRPPFHQKALPAIPPTELGDTNLLLRVLEYCTAVTFFPKAQCAATACGFQHPSRGTFR